MHFQFFYYSNVVKYLGGVDWEQWQRLSTGILYPKTVTFSLHTNILWLFFVVFIVIVGFVAVFGEYGVVGVV